MIILPQKFERAYPSPEAGFFLPVGLDDIASPLPTDAHVAPYRLVGAIPTPRIRVGAVEPLTGEIKEGPLRGERVEATALVLDIDGAAHAATPEWKADQVEKALTYSPAPGWHYTKGGIHLFWELDPPLPPAQADAAHRYMVGELAALGVEVDPKATGWNRLYRLGDVVRDGERQNYPTTLPEAPLTLPPGALEPFLFEGITQVKTPWRRKVTPEGGRDTYITAAAGALRRRYSTLEPLEAALLGINREDCKPPLADQVIRDKAAYAMQYPSPAAAIEKAAVDGRLLATEGDVGRYILAELAKQGRPVRAAGGEVYQYQPNAKPPGWECIAPFASPSLAPLVLPFARKTPPLFYSGGSKKPRPFRDNLSQIAPVEKVLRLTLSAAPGAKAPLSGVSRGAVGFLDGVYSEGHLSPHSPDQAILAADCFPFPYQGQRAAPEFVAFLGEIWEGAPDLAERIEFLRRWLGLTLLGLAPTAGVGVVLVGEGSTGKSTLHTIIEGLFPANQRRTAALQDLGQEYTLASLVGARLVGAAELDEDGVKHIGRIKALLTGDLVTGRPIYRAPVTFRPTAGFLYSTNALPQVKDSSTGWWRRWAVLTFDRVFQGEAADLEKASTLLNTKDRIVRWALVGAEHALSHDGGFLPLPVSALTAVDTWRGSNDPVYAFLRACSRAHTAPSKWETVKSLHAALTVWVMERGGASPPFKVFVDILAARGDAKQYRKVWRTPLRSPSLLGGV